MVYICLTIYTWPEAYIKFKNIKSKIENSKSLSGDSNPRPAVYETAALTG